jgi:hypothetical protein
MRKMREKMDRATLREKESSFMHNKGDIAALVKSIVPDFGPVNIKPMKMRAVTGNDDRPEPILPSYPLGVY